MRPEFEIQTPSLAASTELLVMAPIKPGFVPTLDTVTYKSRVKVLLRTLHAGRQSQHEYRLLRAMSDAVERVGVIRSLRVTVVDGQREEDDRILLSVHFDGSYEAYARTIWQKSARLLDLIFCNAVDYPTGWDHPFDEWNAWIRSVQVPTPFFYATPGLTYPDQTYLLMLERRDRGGPDDEIERTRIAVPAAEDIAWSMARNLRDPTRRSDARGASTTLPLREALAQNLSALAGIYRLADWYRPGTLDGDVLLQAAQELMPQLADMFAPGNDGFAQSVIAAGGHQLARQISWFVAVPGTAPPTRAGTVLPEVAPRPDPPDDVQGGILDAYDKVTDGAMCLLAFDDAAAAARFLESFQTTKASDPAEQLPDTVLANLALTLEGLRMCGLDDEQLQAWPLEFRQGMAARAGLLGDVRWNHPRRWTLPRLNWPASAETPGRNDAGDPALPLESVHAIVQFRICATSDAQTSLAAAMHARVGAIAGVRVLSLQWLSRQNFDTKGRVIDHFGYSDGESQPAYGPNPKQTQNYDNQVHLGEVLVGYPNAADRAEDLAVNRDPETRALMRNGSFLVVRKLRQDVAAFRATAKAAASANGTSDVEIRGRMMGRWPADAGAEAGKPLARLGDGGLNDFDYLGDEAGDRCPLGAHIRRANPRRVVLDTDFPRPAPGGRAPRLVRRGLPYGPAADQNGDPVADRGLLFMAYNASLAEQFEVTQSWLAGGNSAGGYSGTACPFLGVPELGRERNFRFALGDRTIHMPVDGSADLGVEPQPLVTLQWGVYAFAPSRSAQQLLARIAKQAGSSGPLPWTVERGQMLIDRLRRVEAESGATAGAAAWKAALEDPESLANFDSASLWAAVRQLHGGVLRIPYGVLVGDPDLVTRVLSDEAHYTACGYRERLGAARMGEIFLGRDAADPEYARLSATCNQAIENVSVKKGFADGRAAARAVLQPLIDHAIENSQAVDEPFWELAVDARDVVVGALATLCEVWFGIDGRTGAGDAGRPHFARGAMDWSWQPGDPVFYPGHFTAASRSTFQPQPAQYVIDTAELHGQALTRALRAFIDAVGPDRITAPMARPVLDDLWATRPDDAVHTIAGAMMGFLPTTEGILRRVLVEWTRDGTLLDLAAQAGGPDALDTFGAGAALLDAPLRRAMKFRPVPEQIWRTSRVAHRLGTSSEAGEPIRVGDQLIVGQVSALHAQLEQGDSCDVYAVFGGRRQARPPSPTHACPGYAAAMGAMTGCLSALLDDARATLGPSPAPGVLYFRGQTPGVVRKAAAATAESFDPGPARQVPPLLLAYGDSWMSFVEASAPNGYDFRRALADLGYDTSEFASYADHGKTLTRMSLDKPSDGRTIYGRLRDAVEDRKPLPLAVLVDGGGNDFVKGGLAIPSMCEVTSGHKSPLERVLAPYGSTSALDPQALEAFLADMTGLLETIIRQLATASCDAQGRQRVPIIVTAYDHPVPDGRPFLKLCPWLAPTFTRKGYPPPVGNTADAGATAAMAIFIDRLDDAYDAVVTTLSGQGIDVRMARLTGVLAKSALAGQPFDYKTVWGNELHPNQAGFAVLAQQLHTRFLSVLVAPVDPAPPGSS